MGGSILFAVKCFGTRIPPHTYLRGSDYPNEPWAAAEVMLIPLATEALKPIPSSPVDQAVQFFVLLKGF